MRPEHAPDDPAYRLDHHPSQVVQRNLSFPPAKIPLGDGQVGSPPIMVVVTAFTRYLTVMMLPSRVSIDLVAGMWTCWRNSSGPFRINCGGTTNPGGEPD